MEKRIADAEKDIALLEQRLGILENRVESVYVNLNNGIKQWIAEARTKIEALSKEQVKQDLVDEACIKEIHRLDNLIATSKVKLSIMWTVFGTVIGAIIMYAASRLLR